MKPSHMDSLPNIDEATAPFSSLFSDHLDRAAIEATVPLADKTIFLAKDGQRYMFQRITETSADDVRTDRSVSNSSRRGSTHSSSSAAQYTSTHPLADARRQNGLPLETQPPNQATGRPRPASGASADSHRASARLPNEATTHAAATPRVVVENDIHGMANLDIRRFSATPFYDHTDGGVGAAEALTDLDPAPRLPIPQSPAQTPRLAHAHSSPAVNVQHGDRVIYDRTKAHSEGLHAGPAPLGRMIHPSHPNHNLSHDHESRRSLPSLMEHSSPVQYASPHVRASFSHSPSHRSPATAAHGPISQWPDDRIWSQERAPCPSGCTHGPRPAQARQYNIPAGEGHYDTQTPIVVDNPYLTPRGSNSSRSDGGSTGRDNVLPGEDVLYDGQVKMTQDLSSGLFQPATLKVFRNNLSHDLRFYCTTYRTASATSAAGYHTESHRMRGADAQLIPIYGYDQRYPNVLYITEHDNSSGTSLPANNIRPFGNFYQFAHFQDLCNLQAKLTGEKVVMDISSVKLVRLQRASGNRDNQTLFNVRVQLWHEEDVRGRRGSQSDVASFVTAGTALSGPLRSRQVPKSSRLMIYLGRLEEWITVFVTDDVEVTGDGQTMVRLRPRKEGWRRISRWPGVAGKNFTHETPMGTLS